MILRDHNVNRKMPLADHFLRAYISHMISGKQVRAARGWLAMEARELARLAGTTPLTVRRFELGQHVPRAHTVEAIRAELERLGIRFAFCTDGEPGGIVTEKFWGE